MRLFFIEWSGKDFGLTDIVKKLKHDGHEIVYWSGFQLGKNVDKSEFPDTVFHDYHDARAGISSPQVDDSTFLPPGESLINRLLDIESTILIMMNKRYEWMKENQKKHLYYRYIQYWDGVLKKYKPDAIIMPSAPHTIYDLVIYGLAKISGIKTIIFELTAIYDRSIVMSDFTKGCESLQKKLLEDKDNNYSISDFEPDIKKYYDNQMDPAKSSTPNIVKFVNEIYSPKNILKAKSTAIFRSFRDKVFIERVGKRILHWSEGNLKKEYEKFQIKPDFSKKFIYMALHYQPECNTCPMGGVFVDQLLAIEILSYCLPKDWVIYVKENPFQWKPRGEIYFSYRYKGFYEAISKLKNVRLVPINTDTYTLIKNAQVVASISGTAPWEGLFRGKPGIVFGYAWYRDCQGVFQVRDVASCKEALSKIENGYKIDHQKIINYLVSFQKSVSNAFRAIYFQQVSPISLETNVANHVNLISKELLAN